MPRGKRPPASIEAELERYRSFIELSDAGIWCFEMRPPVPVTLDADAGPDRALEVGRLVECNRSLTRMYGYDSASELLGMPLSWFLPPTVDNREYLRAFWTGGFRLENGHSEETDRDGKLRYFVNNLVGIVREGALTEVWGTQRDVTERRLLEARLLEAQRMEAVGQLAGGIAHDFNNMLMVITGNLGVVIEQTPLPADDEDALQEALRAADRATELTRQLLTFSRRTMVRKEVVDLARATHGVFGMLRRVVPEAIRFDLDVGSVVPPVLADRSQIEQMLINLTVNARDAMPEGGTLRVTLTTEIDAEGGEWAVLVIADDGRGMDEETLSRIFEPFFTSKDRSSGTGLGLSVVYGIVKRCGGTIEVASELGRGTTFTLRLPACSGAVATDPGVVPLGEGRRARVLLLEDRRDVLVLVRRFLEGAGHSVLCAEDADDALALVATRAGDIDLLLCDVVLPGTNGVEFARGLRKRWPRIRVILMSGYSDVPELTEDLGAGCRFMTKPFSREQLEQQIQLALADAPASERADAE